MALAWHIFWFLYVYIFSMCTYVYKYVHIYVLWKQFSMSVVILFNARAINNDFHPQYLLLLLWATRSEWLLFVRKKYVLTYISMYFTEIWFVRRIYPCSAETFSQASSNSCLHAQCHSIPDMHLQVYFIRKIHIHICMCNPRRKYYMRTII